MAAYLVGALVITGAFVIVHRRSAAETGLNRTVHSAVGLRGDILPRDVASAVSLDVLEARPELPRRFFSAHWSGFWFLPRQQTVEVRAGGDDQVEVSVDGQVVLLRNPAEGMHAVTRTLNLEAGPHALDVVFEQHGGAYALNVSWAPAGGRQRAFAGDHLFHTRPSALDFRLARAATLLRALVVVLWIPPLALALFPLALRSWRISRVAALRIGARLPHDRIARVGVLLIVAAVVVRSCLARLDGWNPESLWCDDLVWGAMIRGDDFWTMLTVPIPAAPGVFAALWGMYRLFDDPEWSLQLVPFACALVGIPVTALPHARGRATVDAR